jgi:acetyl esterase/lipase
MGYLKMKQGIVLMFLLCVWVEVNAQEFIPLWPAGGMPNSRGMMSTDSINNERIYRVGNPGIYAFFPSRQENVSAAVVIFPGGGYARLAYEISGFQIAKWFNTMGVSAFVVKYRLPDSPDLVIRHLGPLQDAQRAMRLVRSRAAEWGIDPGKVGVFGTSAGGHLAASLSTLLDDVSKIEDTLKQIDYRPDFAILISPVITMGVRTHNGSKKSLLGESPEEKLVLQFSLEKQVSKRTPPAFVVHAFDDKSVPLWNSLAYFQALSEAAIPSSLHVFPQGGHAIALRNNPGSTAEWVNLCEEWLREMKFVELPRNEKKAP